MPEWKFSAPAFGGRFWHAEYQGKRLTLRATPNNRFALTIDGASVRRSWTDLGKAQAAAVRLVEQES
ncbi:hypothetical protein [Acrocarpospora sp. B8E8]|uniref:hypothetical protein n=1 Tax=Acrocarpospora sp. B8E8 TaxID=3153572 RepID=UPI00325E71B2